MIRGTRFTQIYELVIRKSFHENIYTFRSELERVDQFQLTHSQREIPPFSLESLVPSLFNERFDDQVPIITLEVKYDYRSFPTRFGYPIH